MATPGITWIAKGQLFRRSGWVAIIPRSTTLDVVPGPLMSERLIDVRSANSTFLFW